MKSLTIRRLPAWLLCLCLLWLTACDLFEYHPYEGNMEYRNLTAENVARIQAKAPPQTPLRFAFISDTQGFFAETEDMVNDINQRDVAFVLHGGDLTNYAFTDEFERMHRALARLEVPYVTVIGNHDCLGEGTKLYQRMYGPLNHSFTYGQNKFIFLNTNYLEFDKSVPDLQWLEQELKNAPGITNKFVISHIAPNNGEANPDKEQQYAQLMRQYKVALSLHGHVHHYEAKQYYQDGITYVTAASANKRSYVLVTVQGDQVSYEKIDF